MILYVFKNICRFASLTLVFSLLLIRNISVLGTLFTPQLIYMFAFFLYILFTPCSLSSTSNLCVQRSNLLNVFSFPISKLLLIVVRKILKQIDGKFIKTKFITTFDTV